MALLAGSVLVLAQAYKAYCTQKSPSASFWQADYDQALAMAKNENKKLFIGLSASFCSICKAIDKTVFCDAQVATCLDKCSCVKLDGADSSQSGCCTDLQKKYAVIGYPTFLLIDPETGDLIKRWGSELYDMPNETFVAEVNRHIAQ